MSSHCSRKSFFAKLGGLIAGVWVVPALFAKVGGSIAATPVVAVRPEPRAVARKEGSC